MQSRNGEKQFFLFQPDLNHQLSFFPNPPLGVQLGFTANSSAATSMSPETAWDTPAPPRAPTTGLGLFHRARQQGQTQGVQDTKHISHSPSFRLL